MKDLFLNIKEKWENLDKPYKILIILVSLSILSRALVVFGG